MRTSRGIAPTLLLLFATCVLAVLPTSCAKTSDADKAMAIADQVMNELGGKERWHALAGLRWTFAAEDNDTVRSTRRHAWDMQGGRHRVDGRNRRGQEYCVIRDLDGTNAMAWIDGQPIDADSLGKWMDMGDALWTNDTYWMLMPYKLRDPGVHLAYAGEEEAGGKHYDTLELTFDQVGRTPGDHYWVYVNRANHRIEKWKYVLQDDQPPPKEWTWEGWEEHDGLWFPTVHRADHRAIYTRDVETVTAFDAATFAGP